MFWWNIKLRGDSRYSFTLIYNFKFSIIIIHIRHELWINFTKKLDSRWFTRFIIAYRYIRYYNSHVKSFFCSTHTRKFDLVIGLNFIMMHLYDDYECSQLLRLIILDDLNCIVALIKMIKEIFYKSIKC